MKPGLLRVSVDGPGGVDIDRLGKLSKRLSQLLDEQDPIPSRYTLEVTSPGLERPLRTPEHFRKSVGTEITVRTTGEVEGERRAQAPRGRRDEGTSGQVGESPTRTSTGPERLERSATSRKRIRRPEGAKSAGKSRVMKDTSPSCGPAIRHRQGHRAEVLSDAHATRWSRTSGAPTRREAVSLSTPKTATSFYAQELDEEGNVTREWDDTPDDFGRIAAQTAKQVILQRIREVERDQKYEEYAGREGDIVTGIIQQSDNRYTLLDLGKVEALLPQAEQVPYERYDHGARLKAYIVEVRKTTKGPQIVVSRTHPGLIKRLFELEVPEIASGVVEIKACAREPGHRTKIAVWSNDANVDPVGACVGARGARVRMVTNAAGREGRHRPYSEEPTEFVMRALQPAKVKEVRLDDDTGTATVIVQTTSCPGYREGRAERPLGCPSTGWGGDRNKRRPGREAAAY